ncbi:MAG: PLP-dependent transferase [Chloracidobacterium sp.]|uniref:PLP-dependent transferase n=1 Tax=Chloracidobacterium validum TaxID=2821543 RepID=A0ABX8B7J0_9BACT|nr:PLP-dependent transferase [Chloracidobacterium validum]QUW02883.1 PLP-dependent transferase [Chloracidobacterium validum]
MSQDAHHIETLAVHAGRTPDPTTGAVMPPIHLATNYERDATGACPRGFEYTREGNPNRRALETSLALLEGGAAAACFASGNAAAAAVFQALTPAQHVVIAQDTYYGTAVLLKDIFADWSLEATFVDATQPEAIAAAMRTNTALVWVETPSNPLLSVVDLPRAAEIAHAQQAHLLVENTLGTPILQRPFDFGADLVVHSTTKFLGGHSDLLGGVVITKRQDAFFERIRRVQVVGGAVPSPFDCWLLQRSLKTLPCRVRTQSETALKVARFLATHKRVERVLYPGLPEHPGYLTAKRQMSGFGGVLSFTLKEGDAAAKALPARTRIFTHATSIGGVESLIEHRASAEGPGTRAPQNLVRLSIGLEHPDDLIADLAQALGDVPHAEPKPVFPGGRLLRSPKEL